MAIGGLLEFAILTIPNELTIKRNLIENGTLKNIFLGSSHVYFGVNPEGIFEQPGNLAYASQSLNYDRFIIENHQDKLANCERVFIEVSFLSLPYQLHKESGGIEKTQYNHFWKYPELYSNDFLKNHFATFSLGFKNAINRTGKFLLGKYTMRMNEVGWSPRKGKENLQETAAIDGKRHSGYWEKEEAIVEKNVANIQKIIQIAKENAIEPILFNTPVSEEYLASVNPEYYQKYVQTCEMIAKQAGVKFLKYDKHPFFNSGDFVDSDHLNPEGAIKFSRKLKADVER